MLVFVTHEAAPRAETSKIAEALAELPGALVLFRDKRAAWDRETLAALAARLPARQLVVNLGGPEAAAVARLHGALGWHAPEAVWAAAAEPQTTGLVSVADHDGRGVAFAERTGVPLALVSPIFFDKGRPARDLLAFAGSSRVARIGLGGVEHEAQAARLADAGADGVAVQRALYRTADPGALARRLLQPFSAAPRSVRPAV